MTLATARRWVSDDRTPLHEVGRARVILRAARKRRRQARKAARR